MTANVHLNLAKEALRRLDDPLSDSGVFLMWLLCEPFANRQPQVMLLLVGNGEELAGEVNMVVFC